MNREIERLFNDFNVDGVDIPIAFIRYRGDLKTFITYHEIDNQPRVEADNKPIYSVSLNGKIIGYCAQKSKLQARID